MFLHSHLGRVSSDAFWIITRYHHSDHHDCNDRFESDTVEKIAA